MLELLSSYVAYPPSNVQLLLLPDQNLIVYPSVGTIVVLDAQSLSLRRALSFAEAFPNCLQGEDVVTCVDVDTGMKMIVAAANTRIVVWALSGVQQGSWRVHSILTLRDSQAVTCLDCQSGLLAVGSSNSLAVYTLILENDLPTWSLKWRASIVTPSIIQFSPSLMYIITSSAEDNIVRIYNTTSGRLIQRLTHPRSIINISWRNTRSASRDDLILYTVTSDATLRVFLPVLDFPHRLQLHASLDLYSSLPFSMASNYSQSTRSSIFWLNKDIIKKTSNIIASSLERPKEARERRLREIVEEGWDLFLRILDDGSLVVSAIDSIDKRPPTLLKQFTLQQSLPGTYHDLPQYLHTLPSDSPESVTVVSSPPLTTSQLFPLAFFDAQIDGLRLRANFRERVPEEELPILKFIRALDGRAVGTLRAKGNGESWKVIHRGEDLQRASHWTGADFVVILQGGGVHATYSHEDSVFTLHSEPAQTLLLPSLESLFTMPSASGEEYIIGVTLDFSVLQIRIQSVTGIVSLHSNHSLPLAEPPVKILPVDPMAWGQGYSWAKHDVLLSISAAGELAFWATDELSPEHWCCTGRVKTGETNIKRARCSSAKKTALITYGTNYEVLTIWDSRESEFASGLEYRWTSCEPVNDLDWTSTPDNQSILAVGYTHRIELLYERRVTYFDEGQGWDVCWVINTSPLVSYPISDSVWLTDGSLLVGFGHFMLLYGERFKTKSCPDQLREETLFDYVDGQNKPVREYHPQMILQLLIWEKVELVKEIIVKLAHYLDTDENHTFAAPWDPVPPERFLQKEQRPGHHKKYKQRFLKLFDLPEESDGNRNGIFSRHLATCLIETLEKRPLPDLTQTEMAHLLTLIQATLEIDEQRLALDSNGLRYLISIRSFFILNDRASSFFAPVFNSISKRAGKRERLRYRDMVWAFHSESQGLLLNAATAAYDNKMCWVDARAMGVPIWLKSIETLRSQMEMIARNEYMTGELKDPVACSIFYFALGKAKLVHGLWRQASWHKEHGAMLRFLGNDFSEPRWRTAALKNAFALLGKRRYQYAAAFFLLGNSLKDAVNVCLKQLGDFQLAIAIARVVEQSNEGPVLKEILFNTVLPVAIKEGNRYLGSWAFWLLHRRDLAVRVLLTPLQDIADILGVKVDKIGEPHYDDPSLALLFSQLRSKTLQTAKGTSEIPGRLEFKFVLQIARVFCKMGCHILALDLLRSWSFDRPSLILPTGSPVMSTRPTLSSPSAHRPGFSMEPGSRRRSSMVIDMDILALPSTRPGSPVGEKKKTSAENITGEGDLLARKAGLGHLIKAAKMDVQVPEFDVNAFF